jgi:asparagine synthase (glutamine-hydrolysing)
LNDSAALEELGALLDKSVRQHLVSDVPLGVFLSGGLDSSSVVAVMTRLNPQKHQTFRLAMIHR